MKTSLALMAVFGLAAVALAQPAPDQPKAADTPPAATKPKRQVINLDEPKAGSGTKAGTKADTKAGATKTDDKGKKAEVPAKIEGMEVPRPGDKGFLGLQIVDAVFKMGFYDPKKKPIAPDASYAVLRWNPVYQKAEERVVLTPGEKVLTSPRNIRPPYNFKLYVSLFAPPAPGADPVITETYVLDFRQ